VTAPSERRRHIRFGAATIEGTLWLVDQSDSAAARCEPCPLLNLSYGGVRFRSPRPLRKGSVSWVLVELTSPFKDAALATIRLCWVCPVPSSSEVVVGARFLRTNKGWIGDEEQVLQ
jgi:PilZ domain